jgi:hypothetical protein
MSGSDAWHTDGNPAYRLNGRQAMAQRPRQPNHALAAHIAEAGLSNKGLARRVVQLGQVRGYPGLEYNHSSVDRWLRGERPRPHAAALIAEVLSNALGRPVGAAEIGLSSDRLPPGASLRMPQTTAEAALLVRDLAQGDLEQRRQLVTSQFDVVAYSSAALRWLIAPRTTMAPGRGSRGIGMAEVAEIREAIDAFRVLDNRLGGGRIRRTVVEYLCIDIAPLLKDSRCTEEARRGLFSAAAELAQLCGWQAHDLEMHVVFA